MLKYASLRSVLLGGAALALAAPAIAQDQAAERGTLLDEIVVTATKRAENVRDVSGSVSAVSGKQLEALGAQSLADYITRVPGVTFNEFQPGTSHVVIRGVATSSGNVQGQGTTAYYINDIPLTEPGWTIVIPDIDAFDVDRVEVLRGPQGSLFGSASMGGAINYIANKADASGVSAAAETTISQTKNANLGWTGKVMLNVPIVTDTLAVRGVVAYRSAPGYLDNVGIGKDGSSDVTVVGGRLSVVWTPSDDTEVSWLSLYQKTDVADAPYRNAAFGDLKRSTNLAEPNVTEVEIHSLRADHDFGFAKLTAIAGYQKKKQDFLFDFTSLRAIYNADLDFNLTDPLYVESGGESEGKSLEVRLASQGDGPFQWVFGGMYFESEKSLYEQLGSSNVQASFNGSSDPRFGPGSGAIYSPDDRIFNAFYTQVDAKEVALFGEASYQLTPAFKVTAGGRLYKTEVSSQSGVKGFGTVNQLVLDPVAKDEDEGFSPKASLTWTPSDDLMVYGLYSEGFRFGTPNMKGVTNHPIPSGSKSDSLRNYEIGVRKDFLDKRLLLDVTAFNIDWDDIQIRALTPPPVVAYATNGGKARIRGVETALSWRVTPQFDLQTSVTYQKARLEEPVDLGGGVVPKGARLPGSSDWSASLTGVYRFDGALEPTLLASYRYVSDGISDPNSAIPGAIPNKQGDYNIFDLRLSLQMTDAARVTLFGENIFDERGITRTLPEDNGLSQGVVRPQTFGVTFNWAY